MAAERRAIRQGDNSGGVPVVRCAIYTRKSTEEGLEQSFNTLDAQREAAEAYIESQRHEGWTVLRHKYDDGGFTGANMDRPALKRLLADVESGVVNCVVVYKVDRLTRSLLDFSRIIEVFDKHGATFVSVIQTAKSGVVPPVKASQLGSLTPALQAAAASSGVDAHQGYPDRPVDPERRDRRGNGPRPGFDDGREPEERDCP